MSFVLKEIVVCSCNLLFDFFVRYTVLSGNIMQVINYDKVVVQLFSYPS